MNHKTRLQNRRMRSGGYPPLQHNIDVARRKARMQRDRALDDAARVFRRGMARITDAFRLFGISASAAGEAIQEFGAALTPPVPATRREEQQANELLEFSTSDSRRTRYVRTL